MVFSICCTFVFMHWPVSNINFEFPKPKWNKSLFDLPFVCVSVLALFICLVYFSELVHWLVVAVYLLKVNNVVVASARLFSRVSCVVLLSFCLLFGWFICLLTELKTIQTWSMLEPDAAVRPSWVIDASVWSSVFDKSAGPTWAVPTGTS